MQKRQQAFENISRQLGSIRHDIGQHQAIQDYSLNIHAENFLRDVFNCVYGFQLENANFQSANAPCLDLIDADKKLAYQITSTTSKEKITNTLKALKKPEYQGYEIRMYYLLDKPNLKAKSKQEIYEDFAINIDEHLFDCNDLIKDINNLEDGKLIDLNHKYFKDIDQAQRDTTLNITDSTVHGSVAVAGQISNSFNETHHHHYSEKNDITPKPDTVPEGLFCVPFTDEGFIGRKAELARLDELFSTESKVALTGIGGVGKTRLAVHYANQQKHRYPFILWVSASTKTILEDSYASIADKLNADPLLKQAEKIAFVKAWLEINSAWLLIFDNADSADEITHEVLQALIPSLPFGKVLFTTQLTTKLFTVNCLPITCFDKQAGVLFLWQCIAIDKQPTTDEISDAEAISSQLAGLPLALKQAAAYIETNQCTLPEYLQFYQDYAKELLDPDLNEHRQSIPDHELPVFATFKLSFSRLPVESQDLLALCAMLYADSIPEEILTTAFALDAFALNQRLRPIFSYGLMVRNSAEKTLSQHRLVQRVLQLDMDDAQKQAWAEQAIIVLNTLLPETAVKFETWQLYERLLLNGLVCVKWISDLVIINSVAWRLLNEFALYLMDVKADYSRAESFLIQSLDMVEKILEEDHPNIALSLNNLALLYHNQGKYSEAESLYQRSLTIAEKAFGKADPHVATTLNNIAGLYDAQGKYDKATALHLRSLAIAKNALGKDHADVAGSLHNLALNYMNRGKPTRVERLLLCSIKIAENALDKDHPDVAASENSLALFYKKQGKYAEAEPLYQRSLAIREKTLSIGHPFVVTSLNNLIALYEIQGKDKEVVLLYQRGLAIAEESLGKDHPNTQTIRKNLEILQRAIT